MFPRIQFIVSSHSPLFLLGMRTALGEDDFTLLELPSGTKLDMERFGEFGKSFDIYKQTKAFEDEIASKTANARRPLILCEGETDPRYLKTAAELLGFNRIATEVTIDWIGSKNSSQSEGGGKSNLDSAFRFLKNNPSFLGAPTLLLYDCDSNKPVQGHGLLSIMSLPSNLENETCRSGIENLLPESVFEDRFYETHRKVTADQAIIKKLQKVVLCKYLCEDVYDESMFERFQRPLEEIEQILFKNIKSAP